MEKKITLEENQTIEINGAVLNAEMLSEILFMQTGKEKVTDRMIDENYGIKDEIAQNQKLLNFLAVEARNFNNPDEGLKYIEFVVLTMKYSQKFRIPGTKEIELY